VRAIQSLALTSLSLAVVVVGPCGCGLFGTRITRDDCERWTAHYREVAKKTLSKDFAKCGMSDKDLDEGGGFITKSCMNNVGQSYEKKDEQCYRDGASLADWKACNFGAATMFHGYENAISAQRGFLEDLCAK
jgi:hypothetical protein